MITLLASLAFSLPSPPAERSSPGFLADVSLERLRQMRTDDYPEDNSARVSETDWYRLYDELSRIDPASLKPALAAEAVRTMGVLIGRGIAARAILDCDSDEVDQSTIHAHDAGLRHLGYGYDRSTPHDGGTYVGTVVAFMHWETMEQRPEVRAAFGDAWTAMTTPLAAVVTSRPAISVTQHLMDLLQQLLPRRAAYLALRSIAHVEPVADYDTRATYAAQALARHLSRRNPAGLADLCGTLLELP